MPKRKILIVDDEESIVQLLKLNLERGGEFEVKVETGGKQALAAARKFKPDLIILDMAMPDLAGEEVALQMKSEEDFKKLRFIFLSGYIDEGTVNTKYSELAGYTFLSKPISTEELISCIKQELSK